MGCSRFFLQPPTLTGHSFKAPWAMMMKSSSFESPKLYLLTLNLKNIISALLTSVRTCWKVPIYYINRVLVILIWAALYLHNSVAWKFHCLVLLCNAYYWLNWPWLALQLSIVGLTQSHIDVILCRINGV